MFKLPQCDSLLKNKSNVLNILCAEMFCFRDTRERHVAQSIKRSHHERCVFRRIIDVEDDHLETGAKSDCSSRNTSKTLVCDRHSFRAVSREFLRGCPVDAAIMAPSLPGVPTRCGPLAMPQDVTNPVSRRRPSFADPC